jgi:hypothetical protein
VTCVISIHEYTHWYPKPPLGLPFQPEIGEPLQRHVELLNDAGGRKLLAVKMVANADAF